METLLGPFGTPRYKQMNTGTEDIWKRDEQITKQVLNFTLIGI